MVTGLRFVWLEVEELDRSLQFYRDGLGLRVAEVAPAGGQRLASVEAGELELILAQTGAAEQPRGLGIRLYVIAHDVDHYAAALRSRGLSPSALSEEPWGGRVAEIRDPDGYVICLVQARHQMMPDEP